MVLIIIVKLSLNRSNRSITSFNSTNSNKIQLSQDGGKHKNNQIIVNETNYVRKAKNNQKNTIGSQTQHG